MEQQENTPKRKGNPNWVKKNTEEVKEEKHEIVILEAPVSYPLISGSVEVPNQILEDENNIPFNHIFDEISDELEYVLDSLESISTIDNERKTVTRDKILDIIKKLKNDN